MTIANSTVRCSYYLVLIVSLGLTGVAFPAETVTAPKEAAASTSEPANTAKPKPAPKAKGDELPPAQGDWMAKPSASKPVQNGKASPSATPAVEAKTAPAPAAPAAQPSEPVVAADGSETCPANPEPAPNLPRADTYKGMPFQSGEEARYILKYGLVKVHVGYGFLRVMPPAKHTMPVAKKDGAVIQEPRWHRVFAAEAYTGDWYKMIFAGHDKMQAFSRPWDFGVTKFYISQNEEKPFVRRFHQEKWLDFDHVSCKVTERTVDHKKKREKNTEHFLQPSADDALGALYKLRTHTYELNKTERVLVYTSEKNWWLEATPVAIEDVKTALGNFKAYKLAVKTYLGKELQQRGKLFVWIAAEHPNRPMIKVEGEVTFGSIYLELDRYTPGAG
ncbi:MAG TPA: DUF3108 domain-containing protein [Oligoflexus sp.]|uniref:DUF3108 domain-containing protein n=1 Tax=Oligoflexus sp. TaxID=1971216 RepID=UPI002D513BB4|nr:DUF3108 domain-containing protein [Oligoflexus sp.]HYX39492.1 DUF3108 domain-containing protein [Oligoflexus sp.]